MMYFNIVKKNHTFRDNASKYNVKGSLYKRIPERLVRIKKKKNILIL